MSSQQLQHIANTLQVKTSLIQNVWRIVERQNILTACMKPEILMDPILKVITSQSGASQASIDSVVDSTDDDNNIDEPTSDLQLEFSDLPVATVNDGGSGWIVGAVVGSIVAVIFGVWACSLDSKKSRRRHYIFHREPHQVSMEQVDNYQSPEIYQIRSGRATPQQQQPLSPEIREPPIRLSDSGSQRYLLSSFDSQSENSRLGAAATQQAQSHMTIDIPTDQVEKEARRFISHYEKASGRSIDPEDKQEIVKTTMKAISELQ